MMIYDITVLHFTSFSTHLAHHVVSYHRFDAVGRIMVIARVGRQVMQPLHDRTRHTQLQGYGQPFQEVREERLPRNASTLGALT